MSKQLYDSDILVIGAGPAGLAAATAAAGGGTVLIVDDNPAAGGQIWRGEGQKPSSAEAAGWLRKVRSTKAEFLTGARIVAQPEAGVLLAETAGGVCELRYEKMILATEARERFLPFPGWTLPKVMGAGGLQALVKSGLPVKACRIVVAGSGPLLLAVAAYFRQQGADVLLIAEQAPWGQLFRFGLGLMAEWGKAKQAVRLRSELKGVDYLTGCWVEAAQGEGRLQRGVLRRGSKRWQLECDSLAGGFHLVPSVELALLLGCRVQDGCVQVGDDQETSVAGVYCAGEATGIGGLDLSLIEGEIAGYAATGKEGEARRLYARRRKAHRFAGRLNRAFSLRAELRELPQAETIVCRCEDVTFGRLQQQRSWREAKLQTRCGMGACQGRICGGATEFLFGWSVESIRPPVFPCRVESMKSSSR